MPTSVCTQFIHLSVFFAHRSSICDSFCNPSAVTCTHVHDHDRATLTLLCSQSVAVASIAQGVDAFSYLVSVMPVCWRFVGVLHASLLCWLTLLNLIEVLLVNVLRCCLVFCWCIHSSNAALSNKKRIVSHDTGCLIGRGNTPTTGNKVCNRCRNADGSAKATVICGWRLCVWLCPIIVLPEKCSLRFEKFVCFPPE